MKHSIYFSVKALFLGIIALTFVQLSARAQKIHFQASEVVPAAEGTVKVSSNKDKGYNIDIRILHLADPQRRRLFIQNAEGFNENNHPF